MTETENTKPGATPEFPARVQLVSTLVREWINRLGPIWVEGQVVEYAQRGNLTFMTLRDSDSEEILKLHTTPSALENLEPKIMQGSRVLSQVKADWWPRRGVLQFKILQMRTVGLGELLARLEALRNLLESEGLFRPERKRPLPFLPRRVGLVCGRNSDALHDVVENAKRRWPDVVFEVREVAVQGATCVREVSEAIRELDAIDDIDVIVVTRGGGSFEDLLPFSDESLVRVVAQAQTPIVAAIGHEEDKPLIDEVADFRASTPTDAARRIVPDVLQEISNLRNARVQMRHLVRQAIDFRQSALVVMRSKPALANPALLVDQRHVANRQTREFMRRIVSSTLAVESAHILGKIATLKVLSPQGTLDRGFAIVRDATGAVLSSVTQSGSGAHLRIRLSDGEIHVTQSE